MKKLKPYTQSEFAGIVTGIDATEMKAKNCIDCSNVEISTEGELSSIKGMEKQITTGLGSTIDIIHQLNGHNFCLYGGTIGVL
jgi:hypothetical protein